MFPFNPPENIRKPKVFWCFQGDQRGSLGSKGLTWSIFFCVMIIAKGTENKFSINWSSKTVNPLNANPEKWSNTLKQIVGNLPTICLNVFDHFMNLALKGLRWLSAKEDFIISKKDKNFLTSTIDFKYCSHNLIMTPPRHFQYPKAACCYVKRSKTVNYFF